MGDHRLPLLRPLWPLVRHPRINVQLAMRKYLLILALALHIGFADVCTRAQTPTSDPPASKTSPAGAESAKLATGTTAKTGKTVYVRDDAGNLIPLANDVDVKQLLGQLRNADEPAESVPLFHVTSIKLTGEVRGDIAELTAVIRLRVDDETNWVRVPIRLEEALLRAEAEHTPPEGLDAEKAGAKPDAREVGRDGIRHWYFRGKGLHTLTLPLSVAVRDLLPAKRLRLTIPRTAVSSISLQVPLADVNVDVVSPLKSPYEISHENVGDPDLGPPVPHSVIAVTGLAPQLDLVWSPKANAKQAQSVLRTETQMLIDLTRSPVYIAVSQEISPLSGAFAEVVVSLPDGFEAVAVDGTDYASLVRDPEDKRHVTVKFKKSISQPTRLNWTLKSTADDAKLKVVLSPMKVERARISRGTIDIRTPDGFRFNRLEEHELERASVRGAVAADQIATAYQYHDDQFRLSLEAVPIAASFTVDPVCFVRIEDNRIEMHGIYRFHVDRGVVQAVEFQWPRRTEDGWEYKVRNRDGVELESVAAAAESLTVILPPQRPNTFEIHVFAKRPRDPQNQVINLGFPGLANQSPATIVVSHAHNLDSQLTASDGSALLRISRDEQADVAKQFAAYIVGVRPTFHRLPASAFEAQATVIRHAQQVGVATEVEIELLDEIAKVTQTFKYDVQFEAISQVRLRLPVSLGLSVQPRLLDGTRLVADGEGLTDGSWRRQQFQLPEGRLGAFDVVVRYELPLEQASADESLRQTIAFVRSQDAEFSSVVVRLHESNLFDVQPFGAWKQSAQQQGVVVWQTDVANVDTIELDVQKLAVTRQRFTIRKSNVQLNVMHDGTIVGRVAALVDGKVRSFAMTVPAGVQVARVWWNREEISSFQLKESPDGFDLRITIPVDNQASDVLSVDFTSSVDRRSEWAMLHQMQWPQFDSSVWVEESFVDLWLPTEQYLFDFSRHLTPTFEWKRRGWFWSRETVGIADTNTWLTSGILGGGASTAPELMNGSGNHYQFGGFGQQTEFDFVSLRLWSILVIGAGAAWVINLMWRKSPPIRRIVSLPIAALMLSIAGVWFAECMKLLIQPVLVGLVMSLIQWLIERHYTTKHSQANSYLATTTALFQGGQLPGGSIDSTRAAPPPVMGTEEPTQVRAGEPVVSGTSVSRA